MQKQEAEHSKELGFGTHVLKGKGERLLNRDGTFTVRRRGMPWRAVISLSHTLLTMPWSHFVLLVGVSFIVFNALFALSFLAMGPEAIAGPGRGFERAFFFSVHTASTIGYGHLVPVSTAANALATLESLVALFAFALVTGLIYARFARPIADFLFSKSAVVAPYRGIQGVMFRLANRRRNQIIELEARVFLSRLVHKDGRTSRTIHALELERAKLAFFPLSWTIVHPIDETSPLFGLTEKEFRESNGEILVMMTGIDDTFSHTVHARASYLCDEIVWNARFANIYEGEAGGSPAAINLSRIHEIEPASAVGR